MGSRYQPLLGGPERPVAGNNRHGPQIGSPPEQAEPDMRLSTLYRASMNRPRDPSSLHDAAVATTFRRLAEYAEALEARRLGAPPAGSGGFSRG